MMLPDLHPAEDVTPKPHDKRNKGRTKRRRTVPLPSLRRWTLYGIAAGTWITGGLWLIYHYYITSTDEFGFEGPHPFEQWWLILHAAFAFWAVWMFGNLWQGHIKLGWKIRARWISGGSVFLLAAWLIVTGYLLYYLSDENVGAIVSLLHWIAGLAGIALFVLHIFSVWLWPKQP